MFPNFSNNRIPAILLLSLLGFTANWFKLELFFNVDFIFGSIFVLLASALCGVIPGVLAALVAGSCIWLHWHHPWDLVISMAESVAVGIAIRRRNASLLAADTFFWLCCGAPLVWLIYRYVMAMPGQLCLLMSLKQSLNGICNAAFAQLFLLGIQAHMSEPGRLPRFRQIAFTSMVSLVLFFGMITLVSDMRGLINRQIQELGDDAEHTSRIAAAFVNTAMQKQQLPVKEVGLNQIREMFKTLAGHHAMHITLVDGKNRVLSSTRSDFASMSSVDYGEGETRRIRPNLIHWIPPAPPGSSVMQRWSLSRFIVIQPVGREMTWKIMVEISPVEMLGIVTNESIKGMLQLLVFFFSSALIATLLSHIFLKPLEDLHKITEELPGLIPTALPEMRWPVSRMFELDALSTNFRTMAAMLNEKFIQQESTYKQLTQETEKRRLLKLQMMLIREQVELDERGRISRELHDSLGQSLQAVKLNLQILKARCSRVSECGCELINDAIFEISSTSDELRDIVTMLRPPILADQNLTEALGWMVDRLSRRSGVDMRIICSDVPENLPEELKGGVFRICQEALSNAMRHGNPTAVEVHISCSDNKLCLTIRDDGSGFDPYSCRSGSGIGIMKERASLLGGTFKLKSYPGQGTGIFLEVTLP